jgi:hypothetical protein
MQSIIASLSQCPPRHNVQPLATASNSSTGPKAGSGGISGGPLNNTILRYAGMFGVAFAEQTVRMPIAAFASLRTMTNDGPIIIAKTLVQSPQEAYGKIPVFSLALTSRFLQRTSLFEVNDKMKQENMNPVLRVLGATALETVFLAGSEAVTASYTVNGKVPSFRAALLPKGGLAGFGRNGLFNAVGLGIEAETPQERLGVAIGACVVSQPMEVLRYIKTLGTDVSYPQALKMMVLGGDVQTLKGSATFRPGSLFKGLAPRVCSVGVGFLISLTGWSALRGQNHA